MKVLPITKFCKTKNRHAELVSASVNKKCHSELVSESVNKKNFQLPCHCEKQRDVAIYFRLAQKLKIKINAINRKI